MNTGTSNRRRLFAGGHAGLCFIGLPSEKPENLRAGVKRYKSTARERFGREIQVWAHTCVVQRDTRQEAEDYLERYAVTHHDRESVDALIAKTAQDSSEMSRGLLESVRSRLADGAGGFPLVGTTDHIAGQLHMLSDAGIAGVLFTWVDYRDGIMRFNREVLPQLERVGLRQSVPSLA